jgi:predicted GNAT superfamily acetyltransferase
MAHYLAAGVEVLNPTRVEGISFARPGDYEPDDDGLDPYEKKILLVEIPADFPALKAADAPLALSWRLHARKVFESLFSRGYLITDFVHLSGTLPRSFYVLVFGESTLPLI